VPLPRLSRRGSGSGVAIGGMDKLITIQTRGVKNAYNQPGGAWSDFAANVWSKIEHVSGKEVINPSEFAAEVTDRFTTPYVPGVTPKMRIKYVDIDGKTRYFDILFVQNVEQHGFFLELLAKEIFSNT
jgi:SPP1 family predicted phage head-tail adaptor